MSRKVVLLVDDNQTHQYSLGKHLEESGFDVLQAHTGVETLELATERLPDVILMDINLPDLNGFEACRQLKDDSRTQAIPVIFHSATHDTAAAHSQATDLGAVSFLSYPINIEHLVSVIRGAILQGQRRRG